MPPRELLGAIQRAVRAFAHAIGVGIKDKTAFKQRFDEIAQAMVNDAVTKGRGGNEAAFRFVNIETVIDSGLICLRFEFMLQLQQIFFEPIFKSSGWWFPAFTLCGAPKRKQQIVPSINLFVHDSIKCSASEHHCCLRNAQEAERFLFARRGRYKASRVRTGTDRAVNQAATENLRVRRDALHFWQRCCLSRE